jgi:hypothetical protein
MLIVRLIRYSWRKPLNKHSNLRNFIFFRQSSRISHAWAPLSQNRPRISRQQFMSFEKKHFYTRCAGLSVICAPYSILSFKRKMLLVQGLLKAMPPQLQRENFTKRWPCRSNTALVAVQLENWVDAVLPSQLQENLTKR